MLIEKVSAKRQKDLNAKKRKYHDDPEKKELKRVKKRCKDKKEFIKQYKKEK